MNQKFEEKIIELLNSQNYKELQEVFDEMEYDDLLSELLKFDNEILCHIIHLIPKKYIANLFASLPIESQRYLVDNISDVSFKKIDEILLDDADFETKVDKEIFNDIIIRAQSDTRHEKLIEIIDTIESKEFSKLKPILAEMEPIDIAEIINDIDDDKAIILFRLLPKDLASDVFVNMDTDIQKMLIKSFTDAELSNIISDLFVDDTVDLIEEMPSNVVRRILSVTDKETRSQINKLLGFPKDSAGSIMTTECITLRPWMTADDAIKKMRKQAVDKETIYTCYVTDDKKKLLGTVSAKDILIHSPEDRIGDFMEENYICAGTQTDKEEVSNLLSKYDLLAIPIVDSENRIVGIVTIDDAIDVMKQETTEDISKMAAITPNNKPYLQRNAFSVFASRVPWLLLLMISATFTGLIINTYETTLNAISPLLFACIPMLMDSGGNAGSQASVTVIRSIALGEVEFRDIGRVIWKEIRVAIMLAFVLALACFAKLQLIDKLIFGYNYTIMISLTVSFALFATICVAKIIGSCLPLFAKLFHLDPAVVASPFITTIVDAVSLIVFCNLSVMLL